MPNKQTLQLLSTAVAIKTNLEYQCTELKTFTETAQVATAKMLSSLEGIAINLQAVGACAPPLGKTETDLLLKSKTHISKLFRELNTQLEKPYLQFQREASNAHSKIMEKMLIQVGKLDSTSAAQIRKHLNQALDIITEINKQLDICLQIIDKCKARLNAIEEQFNRLNLPNSLEATTKEVINLSTTLANLNMRLVTEPAQSYQPQFLPLQQALHKLREQSESLIQPLTQVDTGAVARNSELRPSIQ